MTKKEFKELCSFHEYGRGKKKHNGIYFDWKDTENCRGYKFGVAMSIENGTKAELFKHLYEWVNNDIPVPWYVRYKYAVENKNRFKVPIVLNF